MSRKMYLDLTIRVIIQEKENISVDNVVDNLDIEIENNSETFDILDYEINNFHLVDSK